MTPAILNKIKEESSASVVISKEHREPPGTPKLLVSEITKNIDQSPILQDKAKKRVCCYARVSTGDEDQLSSLQFQIVHYTYFIHKNPEWQFAGMYADEAASGTSTKNRTNFNKMIADCCAGKIDMIITKSISRFSRNTLDCIKYVRMLKALPNPIEIYFDKENITTSDEKSELLLTILSTLAQDESRNISENVKWGRRKLAERGIMNYPAHRFYGFDSDKNGNWIINEEQAKVIKRIFNEYLQGRSIKAIARSLTEDGVVSPGHKSWNTTGVYNILRTEKSIGSTIIQKYFSKDYLSQKMARNRGELPQYLIENHHPAIIELKVYEAAQQERERRKRIFKNAKKHPNQTAFFKMFYCAQCGSLMTHTIDNSKLADGKRKIYHYWRCRVALGDNFSSKCKATSYREEILEQTFMAMLMDMKQNPKLVSEANQAIQEVGLKQEEQRHMVELQEEVKRYYHELYKQVEANRERDDFDIQSPEIKNVTDKIIAIEKALEAYNERIEKANQMQEDLNWLLEELEKLDSAKEFRDDIFRRIIKRGEVHADGRIVYDLCLGIKWTAYGNDKKMPKSEDSNKK